MNIQEVNLNAIADAIREKDGSTGKIAAADFPARIRAIETGGKLPEDMCTITVSSNDEEGGTVSGGGAVQKGMTVVVTANPLESGYNFIGWYEGDQRISNDTKYSFEVDGPKNLIGSFVYNSRLPKEYTELEYITTTTTTRLMTDVDISKGSARVVLDIASIRTSITETFNIFSAADLYVGSYVVSLQALMGGKTRWLAGIIPSSGDPPYGDISYPIQKDVRVTVDFDTVNKTIKLGSKTFGFSPGNGSVNQGTLLYFGYPKGTVPGLDMRIYSAQAYVGEELKGDFIPCKNLEGRVGLYNSVTKLFCYNQYPYSSAEPIAGPSV